MSTTTLVQESALVVPLRAAKRPSDFYPLRLNKLARTDSVECGPCATPPFTLMRMCSIHANKVNLVRNRSYTPWVPFTTVAEEVRAVFDSLAAIEQKERELGVHSYASEGPALSYHIEAAVATDETSGEHRFTHTAEVDTSGIHLSTLWPRVGEWCEVAQPRMFSRAA